MDMIQDVLFKELMTNKDQRGFFREVIRKTDDFFNAGFAQWSHSLMLDGVLKAWHYHKIQTDYFYVAAGVARIGLCDMRPSSPTYKKTMDFLMGDDQRALAVKVPPGIAHGVQTIRGPVHMMYLMSHTYNPDDEIRIEYNDPAIDFKWR